MMEILEGTFQCPPSIDDYTRNFIEALQFPSLAVHLQKVLTLLHLPLAAGQRAHLLLTLRSTF